MKRLTGITLTVVILICFAAAPFASAQNATPSQAPLNYTQPGIIVIIGAAAAVLFFVLLYKMKKKSTAA